MCTFKRVVCFMACMLVFAIPALAAGPDVGSVVAQKGDAMAVRDKKNIPLMLKAGIQVNDTIVTADAARLKMLFLDDSVLTMSERSRMLISEFLHSRQDRGASVFNLLEGKMRAVVGKTKFQVNTPTAVAAARGTIIDFETGTREGRRYSTITCLEGVVDVKHRDPAISGSVALTAGNSITIMEAESLPKPAPAQSREENSGRNSYSGFNGFNIALPRPEQVVPDRPLAEFRMLNNAAAKSVSSTATGTAAGTGTGTSASGTAASPAPAAATSPPAPAPGNTTSVASGPQIQAASAPPNIATDPLPANPQTAAAPDATPPVAQGAVSVPGTVGTVAPDVVAQSGGGTSQSTGNTSPVAPSPQPQTLPADTSAPGTVSASTGSSPGQTAPPASGVISTVQSAPPLSEVVPDASNPVAQTSPAAAGTDGTVAAAVIPQTGSGAAPAVDAPAPVVDAPAPVTQSSQPPAQTGISGTPGVSATAPGFFQSSIPTGFLSTDIPVTTTPLLQQPPPVRQPTSVVIGVRF